MIYLKQNHKLVRNKNEYHVSVEFEHNWRNHSGDQASGSHAVRQNNETSGLYC